MQNLDASMQKKLQEMVEYTQKDLDPSLDMINPKKNLSSSSEKSFWGEYGPLLSKAALVTMISTSSLVVADYMIGKAFQKQRQKSLEQTVIEKQVKKPRVYYTTNQDETLSDISRATGWSITKLKQENDWMTKVNPRALNMKPGLPIYLPQDSAKKSMNRFTEFISDKENYALLLSQGQTLNYQAISKELTHNYELAKNKLKKNNLLSIIKRAATHYNLDSNLLQALLITESGGNPNTRDSVDGAVGLGQIMPQEFRSLINLNNKYKKNNDFRYNPRIPRKFKNKYHSQLKNPELNIALAAMSLEKNLDAVTKAYPELTSEQQQFVALSGYNSGPRNNIKGFKIFKNQMLDLTIDAPYLIANSKEQLGHGTRTYFYFNQAKKN